MCRRYPLFSMAQSWNRSGFEIQGPRRDLLERKFERESLGIELFLPTTADRGDIEFGGFVQTGPGSEQPGF